MSRNLKPVPRNGAPQAPAGIPASAPSTNITDPREWVCAAEIPKLVPSCHPGRKLGMSTVYRWILTGKLPAVRRGRHYFVRRDDLFAFMRGEPAAVPQVPCRTQREAEEEERRKRVDDYLDSVGL